MKVMMFVSSFPTHLKHLIWHDFIVLKLKQNGISDNFLNLLLNFFRNTKERVVCNGQPSSWADVNAGDPQGSVLDPSKFLQFVVTVMLFPSNFSIFHFFHALGVKMPGPWFLNFLNSLDCSRIFLMLVMYLNWPLFQSFS